MPHIQLVADVTQDPLEPLAKVRERTGINDMQELLDAGEVIHLQDDADVAIGVMPEGMASGAPAVTFAFTLPDGKAVLVETSLKLFLAAGDAFKARHGDPR